MTSSVLFPLLLASVSPQPYVEASPGDPRVQVWLSSDAEYRLGDYARVYVRAADDGYLVVLHADPQGRVRVLFPMDPGLDDDYVRGGESLEIRGRGDRDAFLVEERSGSGVVLAAWSEDPFRFDSLVRGDHWDYRALAPNGLGNDLEAGLLDIVHDMSPTQRFSYDAIPYVVGRPASYDRTSSSVYVGLGYGNLGWRSGWNSSFHLSLGFGNSFYYDPWYYDPWYAYGRPYWYRPVWYRPVWYRPVWHYDPWYHPYRYTYRYHRPSRPGLAWGRGWSDDDGWGRGRAKPRGSSVFQRDLILTEGTRGGISRIALDQPVVSTAERRGTAQPLRASSLPEQLRSQSPPNEPSRARVIPGVERRGVATEASPEPRSSEPSRSRIIPGGVEPERRGVRTIQSQPPASEPSRARIIPGGIEPERRGVRTIQSQPPASEPSRARIIPGGVQPERRGVRTIQSEPPASEPSRSRAIPRAIEPERRNVRVIQGEPRASEPSRSRVMVPGPERRQAQPVERSRAPERSFRDQVTVERGNARAVPRENVQRSSGGRASVRSSPPARSQQSRPAPSVRSGGSVRSSGQARPSSGTSRGSGVARGRRN
jgi:hypothetical protein